ncbi:unnamed protein product [Symbiodinium sp. CCMP2592]|nr:unnamed protein product [Symbiodinium sp. CCMP2592]
MPKESSGHLEVPTNVMDMWEAAGTQRDALFSMWAKSGGVKAVLIERVTIMSKKTRSQKLVVKGGFYSRDDMKSEQRIEKIVKWAESKGLTRPCEYDSDVTEYWVNTRTEGTLTKEDLEEISRQKEYEGSGGTDLEMKPLVHTDGFNLDPADPMLGMSQQMEGDTRKPVATQVNEYLRETLRAKNSLQNFLDRLRTAAGSDGAHQESIRKLETVYRELDNTYDELADAKAEGRTGGFTELTNDCEMCFKKAQKLMSKAATLEAANKMLRKRRHELLQSAALCNLGDEIPTGISEMAYLLARKYAKGAWDLVPAKDLVVDAKAASRRDPCEVLGRLAKCKESSADAPVYQIFRDNGMTMGINFSYAKVGSIERFPYIDPRDLVEQIADKGFFHRVLGLRVEVAEKSLIKFWDTFRLLHPRHPIFDQYMDMQHVIPYYFHGDGGRGFKKEAVDIFSMIPCLGSGSRKRPVHLAGSKAKRSYDETNEDCTLGINLRGITATTRFLFTVLGSLVAKNHPDAFDGIAELWGKRLQSLFLEGFWAHGNTWRIAIVGFTGDSPFVKKIAHMTRSFHNVRKAASSKRNQPGCCMMLLALSSWLSNRR